MSNEAQNIANTILNQMGGARRLTAMTGAKNFLFGHKGEGIVGGISFKFPRPRRGAPNFCKILLTTGDTYTVEFGSCHGFNYKVKSNTPTVYADMLKAVFEKETGLYLTL